MFRLIALFSNLVINFKLLPSLAFSLKACALHVPRCLCPFFLADMQHAGILVPWQGTEPVPLRWKHRVSTTGPPGSPSLTVFPTWEIVYVHHNALLLIIHNFQTSPENKHILLVTTRPHSCPEKLSVILWCHLRTSPILQYLQLSLNVFYGCSPLLFWTRI